MRSLGKSLLRSDFKYFQTIPTRWMDNDVYGHVNNVNYYSYFDTVVNQRLVEKGFLHIDDSPVIGLVVETSCSYFIPVAFPDVVHAGLRVVHLGISSVRYEVGIFKNDILEVCAAGYFVHVYVDRFKYRPAPLPEALRADLEGLLVK